MTLIVILIFGSSVALGLALASAPSRTSARKRLIRLADGTRVVKPTPEGTSLVAETTPAWMLRLLGLFAPKPSASNAAQHDRLRKRLIEAGYRRASAATVYLGGRVVLGVALPLLLLVVLGAVRLEHPQLVALILVATGVGYVFPGYWVDRRRKARQLAIEHGLPDALDLMVVCVQAGLGIVASLDRVIRELPRAHPILCAEFELTIYEIRAGKSTTDGLRNLAERTGVSDVSALVAMLAQTERFGTSISDTLRVHADSLRSRRMLRAEEMANKAPLKMLFPTTLIFFATFVVTIGPAMTKILMFFQEH